MSTEKFCTDINDPNATSGIGSIPKKNSLKDLRNDHKKIIKTNQIFKKKNYTQLHKDVLAYNGNKMIPPEPIILSKKPNNKKCRSLFNFFAKQLTNIFDDSYTMTIKRGILL